MRLDIVKGAILGALVASAASILLAQSWTAPRTWATGDLLTAGQFNSNFRDNLLNLRANAPCTTEITGTASATTVLLGDCRWDAIGPSEIDPESATEGQVMLIGSGGDPEWQFPLSFLGRRALGQRLRMAIERTPW